MVVGGDERARQSSRSRNLSADDVAYCQRLVCCHDWPSCVAFLNPIQRVHWLGTQRGGGLRLLLFLAASLARSEHAWVPLLDTVPSFYWPHISSFTLLFPWPSLLESIRRSSRAIRLPKACCSVLIIWHGTLPGSVRLQALPSLMNANSTIFGTNLGDLLPIPSFLQSIVGFRYQLNSF